MAQHVYSVTELNTRVKALLDGEPELSGVYVRGEISNYKLYPSGHHYFTLKDREGALRCVMFKGQAQRLRFRPENGMKVIALGRVTVFPRDGAYQLYCDALAPDGVGDLHVAFEQLKERLWREGLFDPEHKKPLPPYPRRVAIITSGAGAVVHDMLRILGRRWPLCQPVVLPVRVQGPEAPAEIIGAIRYANRWKVADLIITGRGGGSLEDLWAFNDEGVARAIWQSELPVISAVGHEPDVTIADFVADARAATPTHAAQLAVPDQGEVRQRLAGTEQFLRQSESRRLALCRQRLEALGEKRCLRDPMSFIQDKRMLLSYLQRRLADRGEASLAAHQARLRTLAAALDALSPLKVLGRGYAMAEDSDGTILRSVAGCAPGDRIAVTLADGRLDCLVESTEKGARHETEEL